MGPAQSLAGLTLDGGWKVVGLAARQKNATGGFFSVGYNAVGPDGRHCFLKAMDYSAAVSTPIDMAVMLHSLTQTYLFEKNLCLRCRDQSLKRVVHAIDSGTVRLNPADPLSTVEYLIFERADGDIRAHLDAQADLDIAFVLRALHHVAVGLNQLHGVNVAHQDLKPSNVLVFSGEGFKVGDLGRAWIRGTPAPHDEVRPCAGDRTYAPPELLYGQISGDERVRRFGCDMYHLGSLAAFVFSRAQMNALLFSHLVPSHNPNIWGGTYIDVLPYVQAAFAQAMDQFKACLPDRMIPDRVKEELARVVAQLCEPDPARRGHPANQQGLGNQYSLERYISILDRLAVTAEVHLKARVA
jgi:serine/threonine protein kinase